LPLGKLTEICSFMMEQAENEEFWRHINEGAMTW